MVPLAPALQRRFPTHACGSGVVYRSAAGAAVHMLHAGYPAARLCCGGPAAGGVAAPLHVSPAKASLGVGSLVGGLGLLAGELASLGTVEALTLATLAASGAGTADATALAGQRDHGDAEGCACAGAWTARVRLLVHEHELVT
jgi:hypothetical protein